MTDTAPQITADTLRAAEACAEGVRAFRAAYPDGLTVSDQRAQTLTLIAERSPLVRYLGWAVTAGLIERIEVGGADLRGADLTAANLSDANLYGADLTGADLHRADLSGADLSYANLRGADLRGANLSGADLTGTELNTDEQ